MLNKPNKKSVAKGLFARNSMGKKIVTCHSCGFQTTWGNYVDWDSKFECSLCSPTKQARMIHNALDVKVAKQPTTDFAQAKDVHTEHCCSIHGCKYGDFDCPIEFGNKQQSYPCSFCQEAIGTDEPYWATSGWSMWQVDKGKEKEELLDKIRQFLLVVEHQDIDSAYAKETNSFTNVADAHKLRVEFDKVFGEEK